LTHRSTILAQDGSSGCNAKKEGKVIVAGTTENNIPFLHGDFALVRYNNDGSFDTSFGAGGQVTADFFSREDNVNAVVLTQGGKIIAAGRASNKSSGFGLAAYMNDGSLDTSFGTGGKIFTKFGVYDSANALALAPDGRVVAAGRTSSVSRPMDFAIARYEALGGSGGGEVAPSFDICLQDESTGHSLQVNSQTGDYRFSGCGGQIITLSGRAKVKVKKAGCVLKLSNSQSDGVLTAKINICKKSGSASVEATGVGRVFELSDGNISNNTCICP
jgi:uncharacterized delta-60 repeat protein